MSVWLCNLSCVLLAGLQQCTALWIVFGLWIRACCMSSIEFVMKSKKKKKHSHTELNVCEGARSKTTWIRRHRPSKHYLTFLEWLIATVSIRELYTLHLWIYCQSNILCLNTSTTNSSSIAVICLFLADQINRVYHVCVCSFFRPSDTSTQSSGCMINSLQFEILHRNLIESNRNVYVFIYKHFYESSKSERHHPCICNCVLPPIFLIQYQWIKV